MLNSSMRTREAGAIQSLLPDRYIGAKGLAPYRVLEGGNPLPPVFNGH